MIFRLQDVMAKILISAKVHVKRKQVFLEKANFCLVEVVQTFAKGGQLLTFLLTINQY